MLLKILHLISATILLISHATFFFRGMYIHRTKSKPQKIDYMSRLLSQLTLATTIITGLILLSPRTIHFAIHILFGFLPLVAIPVVFFFRILLRKKKSLPWLLPLLNLIFITVAFVTGIMISLKVGR